MPALSSATDDPAPYPDEDGGGSGAHNIHGGEVETKNEEHGNGEISEHDIIKNWFPRFLEQSTTMIHNATEHDQHKMLQCFNEFVHSEHNPKFGPDACPVKFDGVSCWPQTPPGTMRFIPCFDVFNGVYYDSSENNASLYCYPNGTWSSRSFYNHCLNAVTNSSVDEHGATLSTTKTIFYIGNSISLIAVTLALWIFISFKDLRCLRNTIHTNLLFTYLMHNLLWILYASVQALMAVSVGCFFFVTLNYFTFTNFMWMFVEGFYLYMLVVKTFSVEKIKLRVYTLIGWGVPVPIILLWVLVKSQVELQQQTGGDIEAEMVGTELEGFMETCPLMPATPIDWMHKIPVLVVLSLNLVFLMRIMWVLITKLRSANTVETQRYRKATKALLVLIPLLGLTYMLMIVLPQEVEQFRAVLLSTQGFWVALFFCFLNSEVQNSIRHHIERWKTARGFTDPRHPSVRQRDESPRPHKTDLCSSYGRRLFGSKRESLCSEVTTMTMTTFVANGYNPVSTQTTNTLPLPSSQSQPAVGSLAFRNSTAGLPPAGGGTGGGGTGGGGGSSVGGDDTKSSVKDSLL